MHFTVYGLFFLIMNNITQNGYYSVWKHFTNYGLFLPIMDNITQYKHIMFGVYIYITIG